MLASTAPWHCRCAREVPCAQCQSYMGSVKSRAEERKPCEHHKTTSEKSLCNFCTPVVRDWDALKQRAAAEGLSEYRVGRLDALEHIKACLEATPTPSLDQCDELVRWMCEYYDAVPEVCDMPNWQSWATPEFAQRYRSVLRAHQHEDKPLTWYSRNALYAWEKRHFPVDADLLELAIRSNDDKYILQAHDACFGTRWPQAERFLWLAIAHMSSTQVLDVLLLHVDDVGRLIREAVPKRMAFWESVSQYPDPYVKPDTDLFVWLFSRQACAVVAWLVSHNLHGTMDVSAAKQLFSSETKSEWEEDEFYPADDGWSRACADDTAGVVINGLFHAPLRNYVPRPKVSPPWSIQTPSSHIEPVNEAEAAQSSAVTAAKETWARHCARRAKLDALNDFPKKSSEIPQVEAVAENESRSASLKDVDEFIQTVLELEHPAQQRGKMDNLITRNGLRRLRCHPKARIYSEHWNLNDRPDSTTHLLSLYWPQGTLWSFAAKSLPDMLLAESAANLHAPDLIRVTTAFLLWRVRPEYKKFWPPAPTCLGHSVVMFDRGQPPGSDSAPESVPRAKVVPITVPGPEQIFLHQMLRQFLKLWDDPAVAKIGRDFFAFWTNEDFACLGDSHFRVPGITPLEHGLNRSYGYDLRQTVQMLHGLGRLDCMVSIINKSGTMSSDAWLFLAQQMPETFFNNAMLSRVLFVNDIGLVAHEALKVISTKIPASAWPKSNLVNAVRQAVDGSKHRLDQNSIKMLLEIMQQAMPVEYCKHATNILRDYVRYGDKTMLDLLPDSDVQGRARAIELRAKISGSGEEKRLIVAPASAPPTFDDSFKEDVPTVRNPKANNAKSEFDRWIL